MAPDNVEELMLEFQRRTFQNHRLGTPNLDDLATLSKLSVGFHNDGSILSSALGRWRPLLTPIPQESPLATSAPC